MLLSVIIPVYNVEQYLRQCLESIYSQVSDECEVVLVNDGSTDASLSILEEYVSSFPRCTTLVSKENGGLSSARNAGLAKAKGEYVYFVDSDDFLAPDALSTILSAIGTCRSDVLYLDCVITDSGKRLVNFPFPYVKGDAQGVFNTLYLRRISILPNAVSYVFSRSFLASKDLRFTEGLTHEDALFKYQIFLSSGYISVVHIVNPFYIYRIGRVGSISTDKKIKNFTDQQQIRKTVHHLLSARESSSVCFYNNLFQDSVNCLIEASEYSLLNDYRLFWDREDRKIMKKGIRTRFDFQLWSLACIHPALMVKYLNNSLPVLFRRCFNIISGVISPY